MDEIQDSAADIGGGYQQERVRVRNSTSHFDVKTNKLITPPMGKTIDLTITFDQRIDLQETPFKLKLPVRNAVKGDWPIKPWKVVQR